MTLTQHAAEDGGGLQPDLRSALVLLLTVSVSFSWTGSHLVCIGDLEALDGIRALLSTLIYF